MTNVTKASQTMTVAAAPSLDEYLFGWCPHSQPAVGHVRPQSAAEVFDDVRVGEHPDEQPARQTRHAVRVEHTQGVIDFLE